MVRRIHIGLGIVVAIIVVVVVLILFAFGSGALSISGPTTLTLTQAPTVIRVGGTQYVVSLHSGQAASNLAYIYIGKSPVFINPTLNVTLILHNSTRVSGSLSRQADMQIRLNSLTNATALVTITPLTAYLNESPDYSRIHVIGQVTGPMANYSTTIIIYNVSLQSTTTVSQALTPQQRITAYLKNNEWYGLMQNYTIAYANTRNCTQSVYTNDYASHYNRIPTGPATYANATAIAPYAITYNVTSVGKGNYAAVWSTVSSTSYTTGSALTLVVNLTTGSILNTTMGGVFKDLSFSSLQNSLVMASAFGNACGILVA